MYHGHIDVPTFAYLEFGNVWTGSVLGSFNYRVEPRGKDEPPKLVVSIWYGDLCFDKSETADSFEEEFSAEGWARTIDKLNELIDAYSPTVR